MSLSTSESRK